MYLLWLRVAAIFYCIGCVTALPGVLYSRERLQRIALPATLGGFFFHFVAIVEMLTGARHLLPVGMHEVEATLSLLIIIAYLLVLYAYRATAFGIFALPLAVLLLITPAFGPQRVAFVSPVIRSGWLFIHIGALMAAYAALIFSLVSSLLYFMQERRLKSKDGAGFLAWLPPLAVMDRISQSSLTVGFHCMTLGLLAGSLIAQESVGARYFLDPKVLLSFGMWGLYILMLLMRRSVGLRGRKAVYVSSFAFLVVISVWGREPFQLRAQVPRPMKIILWGVNHKTAPVEVRERLAIPAEQLADVTRQLLEMPGTHECLVLSTCNRVEFLICHDELTSHAPDVLRFLAQHFSIDPTALRPHLYEYVEREAVQHLFRVASSLDSMVVGEPQILGQVKESYSVARSVGAVQASLDKLLRMAIVVAKKVRTETQIGSSSVSIASTAVDLAKRIYGSLEGRQVLLVGAGKMSELAARHLIQHGTAPIMVANRTAERAELLAQKYGGQAIPFEDLYAHADRADIIITSTGSSQPIFRREQVRQMLQKRRNQPIFFVDIAVPRDVDPSVNNLDSVFSL